MTITPEQVQLVGQILNQKLADYEANKRHDAMLSDIDTHTDAILRATINKSYDEAVAAGGRDEMVARGVEASVINHVAESGTVDIGAVQSEVRSTFHMRPSPSASSTSSSEGDRSEGIRAAERLEGNEDPQDERAIAETWKQHYDSIADQGSEATGAEQQPENLLGVSGT